MPFNINPEKNCATCPHGYCVTYIREQSKRMKDRDTQYRLAQKFSMACTFDNGVPGFEANNLGAIPLSDLVNQCIENGKLAGKFIEDNVPQHYGKNVEEPFSLTSGQIGKVRGDIFETLSRAILWNSSLLISGSYKGEINQSIKDSLSNVRLNGNFAAITLGDNYDLKKLFNKEATKEFERFESHLEKQGTSFCYSTPDLIVIRLPDAILPKFSKPIDKLSVANQDMLSNIRKEIEGYISPSDIVLAAGIKTSIRSDRMYQLLFEANAWKAIWRKIYDIEPSKYFSLIGQSYGADPVKLNSVEFTSLSGNSEASKAIDGLVQFSTPLDLVDWYGRALA